MNKQHLDGCIKCPLPPCFLFTLPMCSLTAEVASCLEKTIETHAVISGSRINFRTRKFIEMERITVEIINKNLNNSESQLKYDDTGMWLIFFLERSSHLIRSGRTWTVF